jgi:hypothetical protein
MGERGGSIMGVCGVVAGVALRRRYTGVVLQRR